MRYPQESKGNLSELDIGASDTAAHTEEIGSPASYVCFFCGRVIIIICDTINQEMNLRPKARKENYEQIQHSSFDVSILSVR